jgi:hypothetical protein
LSEATPPAPEAAASGGGVSGFIPTPSWQTGTGVPAARAGRYAPDIAFPASIANGEVFCIAATNELCGSSNGAFSLGILTGTGGAPTGGIAALLDEKVGKAQGSLNPHLYEMAASSPTAFHDITVATSGVSGCTVKTPSMCNNSIPGPTGLSGGQQGYLVGTGYDEVTGLGSLDVGKFIAAYVPFKSPLATTVAASAITATAAKLAGTLNPQGQQTQYEFLYGTSSTLAGGTMTAAKTVSGTSAIAVNAEAASLIPGTKYYFRLMASSAGGNGNGAILSFTTPKASQTITFTQPPSHVTYGVAPISLSAKSTSGLPITFTVVAGHAKISGSTLTITSAGTLTIAANQAGNKSYLAATAVKRTIIVKQAQLKVIASNESMTQGGAVPALGFTMTGFVNGQNRGSATKGKPALSTTATSNSVAGTYPIIISAGTMAAPNYALRFVNGTMTVK